MRWRHWPLCRQDVVPASDGLTLQSNDGATFISVESGEVRITAANVTVTGDIGVSGTVDGVDVGSHTHGGVTSGGDSTGADLTKKPRTRRGL